MAKPIDVSELYQRIHTADQAELDRIKGEGILLGHHGVIRQVYCEQNVRLLRQSGAPEPEIDLFIHHYLIKDDLPRAAEIARNNGVFIKRPSSSELEAGLRCAVGRRGFSIDDRNTSVGAFYQGIFGSDFTLRTYQLETKEGLTLANYGVLGSTNRYDANRLILEEKGYIPLELAQ
jgi:hypothetical protein